MVKIRLKRFGKRNRPTYRIVVTDSRSPRDGRTLDELGYYIPYREPSVLKINLEAYKQWINKGAQPTRAVENLIKIQERNVQ